jgi:hypothetical protein
MRDSNGSRIGSVCFSGGVRKGEGKTDRTLRESTEKVRKDKHTNITTKNGISRVENEKPGENRKAPWKSSA